MAQTRFRNQVTARRHRWIASVLVPVDLSDCSRHLIECAASFAATFAARVTLLHVVEPHLTGSWALDLAGAIYPERVSLKQQLSMLARTPAPKGVTITTALVHGGAAFRIVRFARENKIDLIIMATHSRKGFQRVQLGSVAERVVQTASCPVLVIPIRCTHREPDQQLEARQQ